jgi:Ala-tRNA(Pro) deacylase
MNMPQKLTRFLKRNKVYYQVVMHPPAFTSPETAQAGHIPGKALVKVVMVEANGKDVMAVLPSTRTVDLFKLSTLLRTKNVRIEKEKEFKDVFWDCETGAMPPFGPLYHMPCYVDKTLKENEFLYFNAGSHDKCLEVSTRDFLRAVKGVVGDFSVEGKRIHEKQNIAA